jgi:hypothetical protein
VRRAKESISFDAMSSPNIKEPIAIYTKKVTPVDKRSVSLFDPYKKNESRLDTIV